MKSNNVLDIAVKYTVNFVSVRELTKDLFEHKIVPQCGKLIRQEFTAVSLGFPFHIVGVHENECAMPYERVSD